jgi:succinate dehydrogenase / fumarate reductase membrane anchor subunit
MSVPTHFNSGRKGRGAAFVADHHGSQHARFMRLTSYALVPLGVLTAWYLAGIVGLSADGVRTVIGRPFPALALIAFGVIGMIHAREGMNEIIIDYVHEPELKAKALCANLWAARAISVLWTMALMLIAAPK